MYITVTRNDAPEGEYILEHLRFAKEIYGAGEEGRPQWIVMGSDQFTFQYIFTPRLNSLISREPGGLWELLIPIPESFHIGKTGRKALQGSRSMVLGLKNLCNTPGSLKQIPRKGPPSATGEKFVADVIKRQRQWP